MANKQSSKDNSKYGRKKAFLAKYNNRDPDDAIAGRDQKPCGRVYGFDFPAGQKPWIKN